MSGLLLDGDKFLALEPSHVLRLLPDRGLESEFATSGRKVVPRE